jgi:fructose-1,6-bisphosphatase/inositol monophosphatase family enzyme
MSYLKKQFPSVPFVAEEQDSKVKASVNKDGYYFVIGPLGGTAAFVSSIPFFYVSVGCCAGGRARLPAF